jgi:hypothetical protein
MKEMAQAEKFVPAEVMYDPDLDAYTDVVLFPKKLAIATELYKKYVLPAQEKNIPPRNQSEPKSMTNLQAELLSIYAFEASEKQMLQLKKFLSQLFKDERKQLEDNEIEMV